MSQQHQSNRNNVGDKQSNTNRRNKLKFIIKTQYIFLTIILIYLGSIGNPNERGDKRYNPNSSNTINSNTNKYSQPSSNTGNLAANNKDNSRPSSTNHPSQQQQQQQQQQHPPLLSAIVASNSSSSESNTAQSMPLSYSAKVVQNQMQRNIKEVPSDNSKSNKSMPSTPLNNNNTSNANNSNTNVSLNETSNTSSNNTPSANNSTHKSTTEQMNTSTGSNNVNTSMQGHPIVITSPPGNVIISATLPANSYPVPAPTNSALINPIIAQGPAGVAAIPAEFYPHPHAHHPAAPGHPATTTLPFQPVGQNIHSSSAQTNAHPGYFTTYQPAPFTPYHGYVPQPTHVVIPSANNMPTTSYNNSNNSTSGNKLNDSSSKVQEGAQNQSTNNENSNSESVSNQQTEQGKSNETSSSSNTTAPESNTTNSSSTTKSKLNPYAMEFNPTSFSSNTQPQFSIAQSTSPSIVNPNATIAAPVQAPLGPIVVTTNHGTSIGSGIPSAGTVVSNPINAVPFHSSYEYQAHPTIIHPNQQMPFGHYAAPQQTPGIHPPFQTANTHQTTSILINNTPNQAIPIGPQFYIMNQIPQPQQQQQQQPNQQQYAPNQMQIHAQQSNQQPTPGAASNQGKVKKAVVSINDNNSRNNNNNTNQTAGANQTPVYGAALINSQSFIYGSQAAPQTAGAGGNQYVYPHGQFQPPNIRMMGPQGNQQAYFTGPIEQGQQGQQQPGAQQQYYYSPAPFNPMIPSQAQFVSIGGQPSSQTQQGSQSQQSNNQQHPPSSSTPSIHNQSAPHTPSPMPQQIYNASGNSNNQTQPQTTQHPIPIGYQSQIPPYNYMPAGYLQSPINQQQAGFPLQAQPYNPYSLQPYGKI